MIKQDAMHCLSLAVIATSGLGMTQAWGAWGMLPLLLVIAAVTWITSEAMNGADEAERISRRGGK